MVTLDRNVVLSIPDEEIYAISLADYSLPGFVSGETMYFGTLQDLEELKMGAPLFDHSRFKPERLKKVKVLRWEQIEADHWKQIHRVEHLNTYGCPYYMSCDCLTSLTGWLQVGTEYYRCFRGCFENLTYTPEEDGTLKPVPRFCWGYPGIVRHEGPYTYNKVFVFEKAFDTEQDVWNDIHGFPADEINPTGFFKDIFGDG